MQTLQEKIAKVERMNRLDQADGIPFTEWATHLYEERGPHLNGGVAYKEAIATFKAPPYLKLVGAFDENHVFTPVAQGG